jgi:hypothetical protein
MLRKLSVAIGVVASCSVAAAAQTPPGFADRVAAKLRSAVPGYEVVVKDSLTLNLNRGGEMKYQLNLDRIAAFCAENADGCDAVVTGFVDRSVKMLNAGEAPLTAEALRVVVRPKAFVEQIGTMTKGDATSAPLFEPYLDLYVVCELDEPTATRVVLSRDLSALKLSPAEAMARARANMRAALTPVSTQARELRAGGPGVMTADTGYTSSWIVFPDGWKDLAARLGGRLIVAVPADNLVIYAKDEGKDSVAALKSIAREEFGRGERPISMSVYRWHESGWEVASPGS